MKVHVFGTGHPTRRQPSRKATMVRRQSRNPLDREPDEPLTFTDVTTLVLLAASAACLMAVLLLGTESAAARIAAVFGLC